MHRPTIPVRIWSGPVPSSFGWYGHLCCALIINSCRHGQSISINTCEFVITLYSYSVIEKTQNSLVFLPCLRPTLVRPSQVLVCRPAPCGHANCSVTPGSLCYAGRSSLTSMPKRNVLKWRLWLVAPRVASRHSSHQKRQFCL